jgi:molybdate transport system ATP-binding protein
MHMLDPAAKGGAYMRIAVEQSFGDLLLSISCSLKSPWTVLFGPSGAGKTSLLRVLGGLGRPTKVGRGQIILRGRTLVDLELGVWIPPAERGIGYVTQNPALFPHMDVVDNITFGLRGLSKKAARERAGEMLRLFAAERLARRKPAALSGGEKQRVALARALAPEPQMLLLDEPFSGLDAALKDSILENLTAWLQARAVPALYVSHDVAEAFQTGADVIVLRNGRIEAHGPASVVLAKEREQLLQQLQLTQPELR